MAIGGLGAYYNVIGFIVDLMVNVLLKTVEKNLKETSGRMGTLL